MPDVSVSCSSDMSVTTTVNVTENISETTSDEHFNKNCFKHFTFENKNHFRCEICLKHPDVVRRFGYHGTKIPAIASENGTRFRNVILKEHCNSFFHKECIKAEKILLLKTPTATLMPMDAMLVKNQQAEASRIGQLMIQVN